MEEQEEKPPIVCEICTIIYTEERKPAKLKTCMHELCEECVKKILQQPLTLCPFCRTPFRQEDVKIDKTLWQVMKALIDVSVKEEQKNILKNLREQFKQQEPTLKDMLVLRQTIVDHYRAAVKQIQQSRKLGLASASLNTAGAIALFVASGPIALTCLGVTTVFDVIQTTYSTVKKKDIYHDLNYVVALHDEASISPKIKNLYEVYRKASVGEYVANLMNVNNQKVQPHYKISFIKCAQPIPNVLFTGKACYDVYKGVKSLKADAEMTTAARFGVASKQVSKNAKIFIGVGIFLEWGLLYAEWKKGSQQIEELEAIIDRTEESIKQLKIFITELDELAKKQE